MLQIHKIHMIRGTYFFFCFLHFNKINVTKINYNAGIILGASFKCLEVEHTVIAQRNCTFKKYTLFLFENCFIASF